MASVTLVIPSHRRGRMILKTLDSVAGQTRPPDQVLIVNDGGYEETDKAVKSTYPQYSVLNIPQSGASEARNTGARHAANEILVFLDDDDTLRATAIDVLVDNLMMFPEAAASFGDHAWTDLGTGEHHPNKFAFVPAYQRFARIKPIGTTQGAGLYGRDLYKALLHGNLLCQPWAVWRRIYLEIGGFCSGLGSCDDWDVYLRLLKAYQVVVTREVLADHFSEPGRAHLTTDDGQLEMHLDATQRELARTSVGELRTRLLLRKRIGVMYKALGDRSAAGSPPVALDAYRRSALAWPFDHVVLARTLIWSVAGWARGARGQRQDPNESGSTTGS